MTATKRPALASKQRELKATYQDPSRPDLVRVEACIDYFSNAGIPFGIGKLADEVGIPYVTIMELMEQKRKDAAVEAVRRHQEDDLGRTALLVQHAIYPYEEGYLVYALLDVGDDDKEELRATCHRVKDGEVLGGWSGYP